MESGERSGANDGSSGDGRDEVPWWKEAVIYQVYPRSFNDTDGDGVGDIPGILERVDYLDDLGVDVVWLSPVYDSPGVDNGYDVRDYRAIAEEYGTMDDWEELLDAFHDRGIRLVMDMVVNHTSDEHEWFRASRTSRDSEYRDHFFWREGEDGDPPNNWRSVWGGPAWTHDDATGESYLHLFHEKQAELNWDTPAVRDDVADVVEWWVDRGVDGFRFDSINLVSKPEGLPDADPDEGLTGLNACANGPRVADYLAELCGRTVGDDLVAIGELPELTVERAAEYVGEEGLDVLLSFEHVELDRGEGARWTPRDWTLPELKEVIERWQVGLADDGWQGLYLNNHDQPRAVSRFADDGEYRRESATMLAALLFTLRGTPVLYQGEEIGMTNPYFEEFGEIRDVATRRSVEHAIREGTIEGFEEVRDEINRRTRDTARTPMQWDDSEHAGFTDGDPWIKLNDDYDEVNVAAARDDPDSVLHHYRRLVDLRGEYPTLVGGRFRLLLPDHDSLFCYLRGSEEDRMLVALNFSERPSRFDPAVVPDADGFERRYSNYGGPAPDGPGGPSDVDGADADEGGPVTLRPYEARIWSLG